MTYLKQLLGRWPVLASALVMAAIVHICVTLLVPTLYPSNAYARLARNLPLETFVILPQAQPKAQVLPYQIPDMRYAICNFDLGKGPLSIQVVLPEAGWNLALYTSAGESFYAFPGSDRRTKLGLIVLPPGDHFLGPMSEARNHDPDVSQVTSPSMKGLAVIRAPLKGRTFTTQTEREMSQAACRQLRF
jgi:uncharacterized membrane protein